MQAVERIFSILQLLDDVEQPMGLIEIRRQLGYPESSTAAILSALATAGYLRHDRSTRTYAPTIRLAHLAAGACEMRRPESGALSLSIRSRGISRGWGETCRRDVHEVARSAGGSRFQSEIVLSLPRPQSCLFYEPVKTPILPVA